MRPAAIILANLFVTSCAAIAVYHVIQRDQAMTRDLRRTSDRDAQPDSRPLPPIGVAPSFARFEALERRMAALERALADASARASEIGPARTEQGNMPPVAAVWTEEQLAALKAMMSEIEIRTRQEQHGATMRDALRRIGKGSLTSDEEERAVALLVGFQRKVWELFPGGSAGSTAEERAATNAAAAKARAALEQELLAVLPAEVVTSILARVQQFPGRFPPDPPSPAEGR
jgi:hypothetical protein